ncbi:hypothetical protein D3C83_108010 [compost metagenome]
MSTAAVPPPRWTTDANSRRWFSDMLRFSISTSRTLSLPATGRRRHLMSTMRLVLLSTMRLAMVAPLSSASPPVTSNFSPE